MNLLLMADQFVGLSITKWLLEEFPSDLSLVVTTAENEIHRVVQSNNIPVTVYDSPQQIVEFCETRNLNIDLGVLAWWPILVNTSILNLSKHGFLNTHPSLLPYNRGKHYNFWAIVEQAPFGVSLHLVDERVDSGDIIAQAVIPYTWEDTGGTLYDKAVEQIIRLFKNNYPSIRKLEFKTETQDLSKGSFHQGNELDEASRIELDREYKARDLLNLLRARTFEGHPSCWFLEDDEIHEVRIEIRRKK